MAKNQELAKMLYEIKSRKGLTQKQIAVDLGVSAQYLSDLANGRFELSPKILCTIKNTYKDVFLPASSLEEDCVDATNELVVLRAKNALLEERIKSLEAIIAEKERLISVLMREV